MRLDLTAMTRGAESLRPGAGEGDAGGLRQRRRDRLDLVRGQGAGQIDAAERGERGEGLGARSAQRTLRLPDVLADRASLSLSLSLS